MSTARAALSTILVLLPAAAAPARPTGNTRTRTFILYVENDVFFNTDRYYTNGLKLTWISDDLRTYAQDKRLPAWCIPSLCSLPFINQPDRMNNVSLSLGQNIYTPKDIKISRPQPDDHPWAGWLYGSIGLSSKTPRVLNTLEISLGVVGPASLAEQTQKHYHRLIGSPDPKGWDHQLKNEPGLIIAWETAWRVRRGAMPAGFAWDFIPHAGLSLGNVYTYADIGGEFRFGYDLPTDFGASLIKPAAVEGPPFLETRSDRPDRRRPLGWYLFLRAEGRAVARNIFLDGNTWKDSPSVDKKPLVGDFSAGIAITYRNLTLTWAAVWRTREFETQPEAQRFGAVSLAVRY